MSLFDTPIARLDGTPGTLGDLGGRRATLLVNVASRCGLTPQYSGLELLHEKYADRGFGVVGVPCNQFGGQEPGSPEEISEFCSATYGVTFPMTEKSEVNGAGAHPLYQRLTEQPDGSGRAGDVEWNFEKFLVDGGGQVVARFRPSVQPGSAEIRLRLSMGAREHVGRGVERALRRGRDAPPAVEDGRAFHPALEVVAVCQAPGVAHPPLVHVRVVRGLEAPDDVLEGVDAHVAAAAALGAHAALALQHPDARLEAEVAARERADRRAHTGGFPLAIESRCDPWHHETASFSVK